MKGSYKIVDQSGGVLVLTALLLVFIIGMAALAIDVGHLMVVRNELRNAADAGALAGARMLYTTDATGATVINTNANDVAAAATSTNMSDAAAAEVITVERGHWCFRDCPPDGADGVFYANSSTALDLGSLAGLSLAALDANTDYVNAVRVVAGRGGPDGVKAASLLAGIFGPEFAGGFSLNAESIAYLGLAGDHIPVDQPFGICIEQILNAAGDFDCSIGTMTSSNGIETLAWSNLTQPSQPEGMTNSNAANVGDLVCDSEAISSHMINAGELVSTNNGAMVSVFNPFYTCWHNNIPSLDADGDHTPDRPWNVTLPLIQCGDGVHASSITPPNGSNMVLGAINVDIYWITPNGSENFDRDLPTSYTDPQYSCSCNPADTACHEQCWLTFLNNFGVKDPSGGALTAATALGMYHSRRIYFKPSCNVAPLDSGPGGWGPVPANIPRLVK